MTKRICSGKTKPRQSIFLSLLVLLLLSIPIFSQATDPQSFTGKVVGVSGGDTIKVMREGKAVKVRLHGIDCPEKKQPFGTRAKQYTSEMAFGNEVEVRVQTTDRYGRLVGEVILPGGSSLNKELVFVGLAWWYRKYAPNDLTLKALEAGARAEKKGLWADKNPIPPWEWRRGRR
jgi:micrococcal nuclease